jgi:hypothetical protein
MYNESFLMVVYQFLLVKASKKIKMHCMAIVISIIIPKLWECYPIKKGKGILFTKYLFQLH